MKIKGEFDRKTQSIVDKNNWQFDQIAQIESSDIIKHDDGTVSHLSNCLVSISPVQEKTPFYLFGSVNKSIIANKISIHEAVVNPSVVGDVKKGKLIAEALISDEVLSLALIQQGSETFPCTLSNLGGNVIDINDVIPLDNSVKRSENDTTKTLAKHLGYFEEKMDILKEELTKQKPSKKVTESAIRSMDSHLYNIFNNRDFSSKNLISNLKNDVNSFYFEMDSTISKLDFYRNVESIKLLDYDSPYNHDESYLYWLAKGGFNSLEKMTLNNIFKNIHEKTGNEEALKSITGEESKRATGDLMDGCIEFNTIFGDTQLTDEFNASGQSLEMRIGMATVSESYRVRFEKYRELFRISFSISDLVRLVRGTGEQVINARIVRYANCQVPFVKLQKFLQEDLAIDHEQKTDMSSNSAMINELSVLFGSKSMKKADKEKAIQIMEALRENVIKQSQKEIEKTGIEQSQIANFFEDKLKKELEVRLKGLPPTVAKKALLLLKR